MSTKELVPWLRQHWPQVRAILDAGTHRPQPVRRMMIPKAADGQRPLERLGRRFLEAGVMADGGWQVSEEGTPQGSPFSPLLANIVLDDVDRELERRGQRFVRYADDLRVYVRSERARQRVMASITQFVEQRLKLRVNRRKSAVAPATTRPMLGFGFCRRDGTVKIGVSPQGPPPGQGWLRRRLRQVRWKDGSAPRPGGATSARSAPTSVALARGPPIPGS